MLQRHVEWMSIACIRSVHYVNILQVCFSHATTHIASTCMDGGVRPEKTYVLNPRKVYNFFCVEQKIIFRLKHCCADSGFALLFFSPNYLFTYQTYSLLLL